MNVKARPATNEKLVFANVILENLTIYFQLFDVSISQWSVANNESELYRLVSMYMNKPVNNRFDLYYKSGHQKPSCTKTYSCFNQFSCLVCSSCKVSS